MSAFRIKPQETFDKVVVHLRQQGQKATLPYPLAMCMYRTDNGLKCAAGCLIPDEKYRPTMEETIVELESDNLITQTIREEGHDISLVKELQYCHDMYEVHLWEGQFKRIAGEHNLVYTEPR